MNVSGVQEAWRDWLKSERRLAAHTLVAYEHDEPMKAIFIVEGPLIWLDDKGEADGYFDVHMYIAMCKAHYEKVGLGAGLIDAILR